MIASVQAISLSTSPSSCQIVVGWAVAASSISTSPSTAQVDLVSLAYSRPALQLLPPGRAYDAAEGSLLRRIVEALSIEFARIKRAVDGRVARLTPSASDPDWLAIFQGDPAVVAVHGGPITWVELVSLLPSEWDGVALTYREEPREPTRASVAVAGDHLRGEGSIFSVWIVVMPATPSLSSAQIQALQAEVMRIASEMIPPTAALVVEIEGV